MEVYRFDRESGVVLAYDDGVASIIVARTSIDVITKGKEHATAERAREVLARLTEQANAAPALLTALREARSYLGHHPPCDNPPCAICETWRTTCAAIALAEGRK